MTADVRVGLRPRVLVIPKTSGSANLGSTTWYALRQIADIDIMSIPEQIYLLRAEQAGAELERCLELAQNYLDRWDYILGECTGAFLWLAVFRLAGSDTPFILIPHYNHVSTVHSYALLLSSQFATSQDIVFTGSRAAGVPVMEFGFRCDPLFPVGIDLTVFRPLKADKRVLKTELGLPADGCLLLYAGRVEEDKNILELLQAFALVKLERLSHLVICCHFWDEDYLRQCQQQAEAIGNVYFVYDPDREVLAQFYNAADLFVSAAVSRFETFGRALVEAMACGTPPVVSAYDGFRETVSFDCGVLVPTVWNGDRMWPDTHRFATEILRLLASESVLQEMALRGIKNARRFERSACQRAMIAKCSHRLPPEPRDAPISRSRLSLENYHPAIRAMWESLEGQEIGVLLAHFLRTLATPVSPSFEVKQAFHRFWFSRF